MASNKNGANGTAGAGVADNQGNDAAPAATAPVGEQRKNSGGGTAKAGSKEKEPADKPVAAPAATAPVGEQSIPSVELKLPKASPAVWEHFRLELDRVQQHLADKGDIRICRATVPSPTCPDTHETGHGEVQVITGETFTVLLSTGETVSA